MPDCGKRDKATLLLLLHSLCSFGTSVPQYGSRGFRLRIAYLFWQLFFVTLFGLANSIMVCSVRLVSAQRPLQSLGNAVYAVCPHNQYPTIVQLPYS